MSQLLSIGCHILNQISSYCHSTSYPNEIASSCPPSNSEGSHFNFMSAGFFFLFGSVASIALNYFFKRNGQPQQQQVIDRATNIANRSLQLKDEKALSDLDEKANNLALREKNVELREQNVGQKEQDLDAIEKALKAREKALGKKIPALPLNRPSLKGKDVVICYQSKPKNIPNFTETELPDCPEVKTVKECENKIVIYVAYHSARLESTCLDKLKLQGIWNVAKGILVLAATPGTPQNATAAEKKLSDGTSVATIWYNSETGVIFDTKEPRVYYPVDKQRQSMNIPITLS